MFWAQVSIALNRLVKSREIMEYVDSENRFGVPTDWLDRVMGLKERRVSPEEW